jgi:hypothetical protein
MSGLPLAKLNRATKHIEDLELACNSFFDSRPYEIAAEDDVDAGKRSYRLVSAKVFPEEDIALICGEISCTICAVPSITSPIVLLRRGEGLLPRTFASR